MNLWRRLSSFVCISMLSTDINLIINYVVLSVSSSSTCIFTVGNLWLIRNFFTSLSQSCVNHIKLFLAFHHFNMASWSACYQVVITWRKISMRLQVNRKTEMLIWCFIYKLFVGNSVLLSPWVDHLDTTDKSTSMTCIFNWRFTAHADLPVTWVNLWWPQFMLELSDDLDNIQSSWA